jgi:hypothetical protein
MLVHEMTDTMTRVTLTNTTTRNTTTISSSSSNSLTDLTAIQSSSSSSSITSTLPLQSISTHTKDKKSKPKKLHTFDDYLIYILKWPVSLIDELGLLFRFNFDRINILSFIEPEAGILYKDFLGESHYPVPLLELYSSFDEYEEITIPWLFEETFEEVNKIFEKNIICLFSNRLNEVLN